MTITYTWEVTSLKTTTIGSTANVVVQTYWKKIGTDDNGNEGIFNGATPFTADSTDNSGPFVPFSELTEENVLDWIKSIVIGSYEDHVNEQILKHINDKINPVIDTAMPWSPVQVASAEISEPPV
jgi:hypothetical protein